MTLQAPIYTCRDSRIPGIEQVEIERRVVLGGIAGEGIKPKD